jgi:hypothetical protein
MGPKTGTMEEIAGFLARFPPYDTLGRDDLLRIAAAVTLRSYPAGTDILIEDGPPAAGLFVIRSGSAELRHQDEVVDILEPGEDDIVEVALEGVDHIIRHPREIYFAEDAGRFISLDTQPELTRQRD